ncbi:MAG: YqgE/AlgH family protein [Gammaproteobacteria bacterium]|nr:YqgE/AlgH family protein [Gammaproteobacteria bacterium]
MNLKNHFLMAMPDLSGDYFGNTLTYICEHNDEGAMGIVVNRPTDVSILELLAKLNMEPERRWVEQLVLDGGPVAQDRGFVLYRGEEEFGTSVDVAENIRLSTAMETLTAIASGDGPENFIIALGYAGWGEGQLEGEISRNSWLTVEPTSEILFDTPAEEKLQAAAQLLGIDFNLIAAQPGHG